MLDISKIKIAHLTLSMGQGGIENLIMSLLIHLDNDIFDPSVICLDYKGELFEQIQNSGVPAFVYTRNPGFDFRLVLQLSRLFRSEKFKVIHTHNQASHFYGCLAACLARVPVVINTEHSRHYIDGNWQRRMEKRLISLLSDRIITVSDELKQASIKRDRISPQKIEVVWNGVDLQKFSAVKPSEVSEIGVLKQSIGIPMGTRIVSIVARLHPIKNHALLFEAMKYAISVFSNLHLLVIGDGELRKDLEELVEDLGLRDFVTFLGKRGDIPLLMKASDVLVLCSMYEGFPLVLLEGMAVGKPIVVTEGANRSGLIKDGENGFICKGTAHALADKLCMVLSEKGKAERVSKAARSEVADHFSISQTTRKYEEIYLDLLNRKGALRLQRAGASPKNT